MIEQKVLFYVDKEMYGLDIGQVRGIEKYVNITPVPNAPDYIEGIINLRGEIIPIFNLRRKFGLNKIRPTEETKLIVTNSQGMPLAFQVDRVAEILTLEEEKELDVPLIVRNDKTDYAGKIVDTGKGLAVLLDINGIFTKEEREVFEKTLDRAREAMG
jgi:purine-binding chemotaxis protein CheW